MNLDDDPEAAADFREGISAGKHSGDCYLCSTPVENGQEGILGDKDGEPITVIFCIECNRLSGSNPKEWWRRIREKQGSQGQ